MRALLAVGLLLAVSGCTLPEIYARANQEAHRLWFGLVNYDAEQWNVRRDLREMCLDTIIRPGIERLRAAGRLADAAAVIKANYPGVTYINIVNEARREGVLRTLNEMPACEWPAGIEMDPAAPDATVPTGPFMLVPAS